MIHMAPTKVNKKREILLVYGHHASLERMFALADYLTRYGSVTVPDLPGFGGMEAFYKIGEKPTLDNLADYLASFIKLRFRKSKITIMAISFGFAVVTRMLQKYPEIASRVDLIVSVSGFTHKDDFAWKKSSKVTLGGLAWLCSYRLPSSIVKLAILRAPIIKGLYKVAEKKHPKLKDTLPQERDEKINFEVKLWKMNDFRTYTYVSSRGFTMLPLKSHVDLPVYHVAVDGDHYFSSVLVEQHIRQIYKDFTMVKTKMPSHAPTLVATVKDVAIFVPPTIQRLLRKKDIIKSK